jgi:iron complex transport system substrate-binding protein
MYEGPMRIVSLLASGTELVCALGAGDELVGRSHECDSPPWVTRLPVLSRPTFDVGGSSQDIDQRVRDKLRAGEPLYQVDEAQLATLAPDVVITQTHCQVCAVASDGVIALRTGTVDGVLAGFAEVAAAIGRDGEGARLIEEMHARVAGMRAATARLPRPTLVCLEWTDPPFALGNWGPELVEAAGGACLLGAPGAHSAAIPWDEVRRADPDVVIVAPCGFGLERAAAEMPALAARPGWGELRAVRTGRVFVADGNLYFNRSGPALFDTLDLLAEMLHPSAFPPRHEGRGWRRWPAAA